VGRPVNECSILEEYSAAILAIRTNPFLDDHLLRHAPPAGGDASGAPDWTDMVCDPSYRLRMGDCLLLETFPDFFALHRNSSSFALVREVEHSKPPRYDTRMDRFRIGFSFVAFVAMVQHIRCHYTLFIVGIQAYG
jgi:hypothetical protein